MDQRLKVYVFYPFLQYKYYATFYVLYQVQVLWFLPTPSIGSRFYIFYIFILLYYKARAISITTVQSDAVISHTSLSVCRGRIRHHVVVGKTRTDPT